MLKDWRKKAYYTQAELAGKLGVSQNTVSFWEHGRSVPDIFTVEKLSILLNVSVMDIIKHFKSFVKEA